MRVGSCFSGVGMFDYGLQQAGYEIAWQIEWDEWCRRVLTKHWPDVPKYSDIREVDANRLEPVDLLIGGYPCQPFSAAGQRQGQADDRHLWPEMFRIIQTLRPTWVIGENVAGHITLGLDDVLSDLESEGYTCQTFVIPACGVGAPHRRERLWIVGHTQHNGFSTIKKLRSDEKASDEWGQEEQEQTREPARADRPIDVSSVCGCKDGGEQDVAYSTRQGPQRLRRKYESFPKSTTRFTVAHNRNEGIGTARESQPRLGRSLDGIANRLEQVRVPAGLGQAQHDWEPPRVATGIPDRVNRLKALGNGGMWQIPYIIGTFIKVVSKCNTHS